MNKRLLLFTLFLGLGTLQTSWAEERKETLSTTYPSPWGEYRELRALERAIFGSVTSPVPDPSDALTVYGNAQHYGQLRLGQPIPAPWKPGSYQMLRVVGLNTYPTIGMYGYGLHPIIGNVGAPHFISHSARGTPDAPAPLQQGDVLAVFRGKGFGSTRFVGDWGAAQILMVADGPFSDSSFPGAIRFCTAPPDNLNDPVRMTIKSDGKVGIGTLTPQQMLHVAGNVLANDFIKPSSRRYKEAISRLETADEQEILSKIRSTSLYTYKLKEQSEDSKTHLGVLAEEAPREMLDASGEAVSFSDSIGFLMGGMKALIEENDKLKQKIEQLELKLASNR